MLHKTHRLRQVLLAVASIAIFAGLETALFGLQIRDHALYLRRAWYQQLTQARLSPRRGDILDRNGVLLAVSHFTETIVLDTRAMKGGPPPTKLVKDLAGALKQPLAVALGWFAQPGRHYVYRKAPQEVVDAVLEIAAREGAPPQLIDLEQVGKRDYPNDSLAGYVLGYTSTDVYGSDNVGKEGVEATYDDRLKGSYRQVGLLASGGLRRGRLADLSDAVIQATFGRTVELTIDQRVQMLAETALGRAVGQYQATGGCAVVMDVATGEILALASCPTFDLATFRNAFHGPKADLDRLRDRALTDLIEVGSVMKIVTASLLLEKGLVRVDEPIDCKGGSAWVGGRVIRDAHAMGVVPFHQAFSESSNIAFASLADQRLESNAYYQGLRAFGLGAPTGVDLPGERTGELRSVEGDPAHGKQGWTSMSKASLAIGYETSMTPMQVICALGAIGNNGWRMRPRVVKRILDANGQVIQEFKPEPLCRVVSPETCRTLLSLMESVVLEGTAKDKGTVPGYRVGGKTGTTVKHHLDAAGKTRYVSSFAGLAPIDRPRLAIYVYVDEPRGAKYGGDVAAPIFREICEQALPTLGIAPSDPKAWESARMADIDLATSVSALGRALAAAGAPKPVGDASRATTPAKPAIAVAGASPRPALPGMASALDSVSASGSPVPAGLASDPVMPDCRGLTMVKAWERLGRAGIQARMLGSGVAVRQEPAAGDRLGGGQLAELIFAPMGEPSTPPLKVNSGPVKLQAR